MAKAPVCRLLKTKTANWALDLGLIPSPVERTFAPPLLKTASRKRTSGSMGSKLKPGDAVPPRTLTGVLGAAIAVPDPALLVHLQFRRFAGCPI
jgi:hypothetical protein